MADKFLQVGNTGNLEEKEAVIQGGTVGEAGRIVALDDTGKLDDTVMPEGIGAETTVAKASEALVGNNVINIWSNSGVLSARKADATDDTKPAHGYIKDSANLGDNVTVYTDGYLPGTGFTPGSKYFLSTTPGAVTATPPSDEGNIAQVIGVAVSADKIKFEPLTPIKRA